MGKIMDFFKHMTVLDWLLAAAFTFLAGLTVNLIFPPNGWMIGGFAALFLLFIAKRRRDHLMNDTSDHTKK